MDLLTFLSNTIGDLAWPCTVIYGSYFIMRNGHDLANLIEKIQFGKLEITLRKKWFSEAREAAQKVQAEIPFEEMPDIALLKSLLPQLLQDLGPNTAIINIWKRLEAELIKIIQHEGHMRWVSPTTLVRFLRKKNLLTEADERLFEKLLFIRNEIIHLRSERSLTLAEVTEFAEFADVLIVRIRNIKKPLEGFQIPFSDNTFLDKNREI